MQIWLFALAGAVAPAPAQVLAASQSPNVSIEAATVTPDAPAVEATAATASDAPAAPKQPVVLDPPAYAPKKPVIFDSPGKATGVAFAAPKQPVVLDPPAKSDGLAAPKKPVIFSPPREPSGWKAAKAEQEAAPAPVLLKSTSPDSTAALTVEASPNSTAAALTVEDPATPAPVVLKSTENSTGAALAVENPTDHGIHDQIAETHKAMCEDGRMDSPHCEKFKGALDDMQDKIKDIHEDHTTEMMDAAGAAAEPAAAAAEPDSTVSVEVESVKEHEPVIKRHEYPYKTGPCAGATAVALIFSGLLFA
jgi:hypothetical protein